MTVMLVRVFDTLENMIANTRSKSLGRPHDNRLQYGTSSMHDGRSPSVRSCSTAASFPRTYCSLKGALRVRDVILALWVL